MCRELEILEHTVLNGSIQFLPSKLREPGERGGGKCVRQSEWRTPRRVSSSKHTTSHGTYECTETEAEYIGPAWVYARWDPRLVSRSGQKPPSLTQWLTPIDNNFQMRY